MVVFRNGNNDDDNEPPEEEPSICYFEPNDAPECEPDDEGNCPNDWPMNEQGNCHPGGECPDDYSRVDDDESGTCYPDDDITICEGSGALVLDQMIALFTSQISQEIQRKYATLSQTTKYAILTRITNVLKAWALMTMANVSHKEIAPMAMPG